MSVSNPGGRAVPVLLTLLALAGCGGSASFCIPGVPCGPVPDFSEPRPAPVQGGGRYAAIGLGNQHSCMLGDTGAAWCWGDNQYGQLGAVASETCVEGAERPCSSRPLPVGGTPPLESVAGSVGHSCGRATDGTAWCWGFGRGGQLGDGRRADSPLPVPVAGGHRFDAVALSLFSGLACGLKSDGSLWCWGPGFSYGSTGPAPADQPARWEAAAAVAVAFRSIALGEAHACGLDAAGRAWCLGGNGYGQLGDGGTASAAVPVPVAGDRTYVQIVAGPSHNCALAADGMAWCWGFGAAVGDGAGSAAAPRRQPVPVAGGHTFRQLTAGTGRSCGVATDGRAWCWGDGYNGALGDGGSEERAVPVAVAAPPMKALAAGGVVSCGIDEGGSAWCWGGNESGAVGRPIVGR